MQVPTKTVLRRFLCITCIYKYEDKIKIIFIIYQKNYVQAAGLFIISKL